MDEFNNLRQDKSEKTNEVVSNTVLDTIAVYTLRIEAVKLAVNYDRKDKICD